MKNCYDLIYICSMSSMHTLFSARSGWPCYNLTSLNMLFNITCTTFLMGCQSCVVSFIFAQVFYNHLHRLVNKAWARDKIIYIPIRFNTQIENRVKPSLCSSVEVFNHLKKKPLAHSYSCFCCINQPWNDTHNNFLGVCAILFMNFKKEGKILTLRTLACAPVKSKLMTWKFFKWF